MTEDNHPLTETKKQKAVRIWLEDEEKHLWTDNHIAEQCGVSIPLYQREGVPAPNSLVQPNANA